MVSPVIEIINPTQGDKNVPVNVNIEVSVEGSFPEFEDPNINMSIISTQTPEVPESLAIINGVVQTGFVGSIVKKIPFDGYDITIRPIINFPTLETVQVAVTATDGDGNPAVNKIYEFVTLDVTPPQIIDLFPVQNAIGIELDANLKFSIKEEFKEVGVDISTLEITVDGNVINALDPEIVTTTEDLLINGYDVEVNLPTNLPPSSEIIVQYSVEDNAGNKAIQEYSFITLDEIAPIFLDFDPLPDADGIPVDTIIKFSIADSANSYSGSGVSKDSLDVVIEGIKAISDGVFQPGFGGTILINAPLNGFDITIIPNDVFRSNQTINVEVSVFDNSGNFASTNYSFRVLDDVAPTIGGEQPGVDAVNVSIDTKVIFSIESEVSSGEIDLGSINVSIDGNDVIIDGEAQIGYEVDFLTKGTIGITVIINPENSLSLDSLIEVEISVKDNVGNLASKSYSFTTEELIPLETTADPLGGVFDSRTIGDPTYPVFNTNFSIDLTCNVPSADIYYTTDGSEPIIDQYGEPIGSAQIYTGTIKEFGSFTLKFFANDFTNGRREITKVEYYIATNCPETVVFEDDNLVSGREYGRKPLSIKTNIDSEGITIEKGEDFGQAIYTYDLGRISTINTLGFNNDGFAKFRVKAASIESDLNRVDYLGTIRENLIGPTINYDLLNIESSIYIVEQDSSLRFSGTQISETPFENIAYAQVDDVFNGAFSVGINMRLNIFDNEITGSRSFLEIFDDSNSVRIEKFLSQLTNNPDLTNLLDRSAILDEIPVIEDAYGSAVDVDDELPISLLTDGDQGGVNVVPFPPAVSDSFTDQLVAEIITGFEFEKELSQEYESIVSLSSSNLSVYDQFKYSDRYGDPDDLSGEVTLEVEDTSGFTIGSNIFIIIESVVLPFEVIDVDLGSSTITIGVFNLTLFGMNETVTILTDPPMGGKVVGKLSNVGQTYSDALTADIFYLLSKTSNNAVASIPIVDAKIDPFLSTVKSLNRNTETDEYEFAETNGIFTGEKFLEAGTYRFRFKIKYKDGTEQLTYNPYTFRTSTDLSSVQATDVLEVLSGPNIGSYEIKSILKIVGNVFSIEFLNTFPMEAVDIEAGQWKIVRTTPENILINVVFGTKKIDVVDPLNAEIIDDASGKIIAFSVDERQVVEFTLESDTAETVSLTGTFNRFREGEDVLSLGFDRTEVDKIFDTNTSEHYESNHIDYNKIEMIFPFEASVDVIRFQTGVEAEDLQRTRILLDGIPINSYNYKVFKKVGTVDEYEDSFINNIDVHTSKDDGTVEWRFIGLDSTSLVKKKKIELMTRLDSYSGNNRLHEKFEVYSVPNFVSLTSDFLFPISNKEIIQRLNNSTTASESGRLSIKYTINNELSLPIDKITEVRNIGLINNPLNTALYNISGDSAEVRDTSKIEVNDEVLVSDDDGNIEFTSIKEITSTGIITFNDSISSIQSDKNPKIVKNYKIIENTEDKQFLAQVEVPDLINISVGRLRIVRDAYGEVTNVVEIDDIPEIADNLTQLNSSILFYPTSRTPSMITGYNRIVLQDLSGTDVSYIELTLDKPINADNELLGYSLYVWNSSKIMTDYIISHEGEVFFTNETKLAIGDYSIFYDRSPVDLIDPKNSTHLENLTVGEKITIEVISDINKVSLADISTFNLTVFNGEAGLTPESVKFTVNDTYTYTDSIYRIIDGYGKGKLEGQGYDFIPGLLDTGQLVEFSATDIFTGFGNMEDFILNKIVAEFNATSTDMYIGEIEAIVSASPINSNCRILVNDEEIHLQNEKITNVFDRYEIQIENDFVTFLYNGEKILTQPAILKNAKIRFGGTARIEDDTFEAEFKNLKIDQFFDVSPAMFELQGRFVRIEASLRDDF